MNDSDLLWPGAHRRAAVFTDASVIRSMAEVEGAWLDALIAAGVAPKSAALDLTGLSAELDPAAITDAAEDGGNPVIPFLAAVREQLGTEHPDTTQWMHRGLTSQDTLDTALILCTKEALSRIATSLDSQVEALATLADLHRHTLMVGRTLSQHALPITFGFKASNWLRGLLAAREDLTTALDTLPAQFGGAAGTLAATVDLLRDASDPSAAARELAAAAATALGLIADAPWHTGRRPVTRIGDTFVTVTDALGRVANDVVLMSRPELGELSEPSADGRGASSSMPQKRNPVLSILIRRAAMTAPLHGAQLHLAAAQSVDERPDGSWHTEWTALRTLAQSAVVAADQSTELLTGLVVHPESMTRHLDDAMPDLLAERVAQHDEADDSLLEPADYLGVIDALVDEAIAMARTEDHHAN